MKSTFKLNDTYCKIVNNNLLVINIFIVDADEHYKISLMPVPKGYWDNHPSIKLIKEFEFNTIYFNAMKKIMEVAHE